MIDENTKKEWAKEFILYANTVLNDNQNDYPDDIRYCDIDVKVQQKIADLNAQGCPIFVVSLSVIESNFNLDIKGVLVDDVLIAFDKWLSPESLEEIQSLISK